MPRVARQSNVADDVDNCLYRILTVLPLLSVKKIFFPETGGVEPRTEGERCKAQLTLSQNVVRSGPSRNALYNQLISSWLCHYDPSKYTVVTFCAWTLLGHLSYPDGYEIR